MENEQVGTMKAQRTPQAEMNKTFWGHAAILGPSTSSKCKASRVIGSFIGMGIVGFCFGIGLMLAVKTVNNLEELIRR